MKIVALLRLFYTAFLVYVLYMMISVLQPDDAPTDIFLFVVAFILVLVYMLYQVWESLFVLEVRVRKPLKALRIYAVVAGLTCVLALVIFIPLNTWLRWSLYRMWMLAVPMAILLIVDMTRPWRGMEALHTKQEALPIDHPSNF